MRNVLPQKLIFLAEHCPTPLYVVGGSVRDHLAKLKPTSHDWDVCAPLSAEEFSAVAIENGFLIQAVYKNTGTVKFSDGENDYEYTCFRSDKYVRGIHVPVEIFFTNDILLDAKRRDFTANAVYYDVAGNQFVDPLHGIPAIQEKRLSTVDDPKKVFGEDGLRLMRLARQASQLGFEPDEACLFGAKENAHLIKDISPERIFAELCSILTGAKKYGVAEASYRGLQLLDKIGVLAHVLPELTLGKDMKQRPDFHKYDVLEHSFRAVKYAEENNGDLSLLFSALLHDVGKPFCTLRDGNSYEHPVEGARLAKEILSRLKAPSKMIKQIPALVEWHMYDMDCKTKEGKLRKFFTQRYELLPALLALKQADFSACMDDTSPAPTVLRWKGLLAKMQEEGAPLQIKDLAISGKDLLPILPAKHIATVLEKLLLHTCCNPMENERERLLQLAQSFAKNLSN